MTIRNILFVLCCWLFLLPATAEKLSLDHCRVLKKKSFQDEQAPYTESFLWQISKPGQNNSYIYGTIHVSDPRVLQIPEVVTNALVNTNQFIMESVLSPEQDLLLSQLMFSGNDEIPAAIDDTLLKKITDILSNNYRIPAEYLSSMQPWAAYLIMNYPPGDGEFLDIKLLQLAKQNGLPVHGLETLSDQLGIFKDLTTSEQITLLHDTACNYDLVVQGFNDMINLYLASDLNGLLNYSNQYDVTEDPLYQKLLENLIVKRNQKMAQGIIEYIQNDTAFIAIGALHLTGKDGVIALLHDAGYTIQAIAYKY